MNSALEIKSCEVCGNQTLEPVLDLGTHPLCDDLVPIGDGTRCAEYAIEILFCVNCATAHQRFQVPKRELFPVSYHYRSRFTADVLTGMSALVDACENKLKTLNGKTVLDIGCNDGSLLNFFRAKGSTTIGIEPTGAYTDALNQGHYIYQDFLSIDTAKKIIKNHGHPDIITFTNVFAHIENLQEVLAALKLLMTPTTWIVIENHYLGAVLERNQFDTFYHEHPRSYSYTSFVAIAKSLSTVIQAVEFPARYGGNIRIYLHGTQPSADDTLQQSLIREEQTFLQKFKNLRQNIEQWRHNKGHVLLNLQKKGQKIVAKAFPGRAAILIKLLGLDENHISSVFEKPGSMKIGHYVPGTKIAIQSDDVFFAQAEKPDVILNLAWHISDEIRSYLTTNGYQGEIIDVLAATDFQS